MNSSRNPHALAERTISTLASTPLAAALSQSGISLPIPFLDLSAQVIRDLPLENVAALQRFIAEAKSELATLAAMVQTGLEMRYGEQAKAQLLAKGQDTGTTHIEDAGFDITVENRQGREVGAQGPDRAGGQDPKPPAAIRASTSRSSTASLKPSSRPGRRP